MKLSITNEEDRLNKLSINELRLEYERVSEEVSNSRHRGYLIKRILWQMQANVYGGLSEAAIAKAKKLFNPKELRLTAPRAKKTVSRQAPQKIATKQQTDFVPGMQFERIYKGQRIVVSAMENGFRWNGELYNSLTAVAKAVTGTHWNGRLFFGLKGKKLA